LIHIKTEKKIISVIHKETRDQTLRRILEESFSPHQPDLIGHRRQIAAAMGIDYDRKLKTKLH